MQPCSLPGQVGKFRFISRQLAAVWYRRARAFQRYRNHEDWAFSVVPSYRRTSGCENWSLGITLMPTDGKLLYMIYGMEGNTCNNNQLLTGHLHGSTFLVHVKLLTGIYNIVAFYCMIIFYWLLCCDAAMLQTMTNKIKESMEISRVLTFLSLLWRLSSSSSRCFDRSSWALFCRPGTRYNSRTRVLLTSASQSGSIGRCDNDAVFVCCWTFPLGSAWIGGRKDLHFVQTRNIQLQSIIFAAPDRQTTPTKSCI